jgi:hypothetical protein
MKKVILFCFVALMAWSYTNAQVTEQSQEEWVNKFYHIKSGNLWFNSLRLDFDGITSTMVMNDTIPVYNAWGQTMELSFKDLPPYVKAVAVPSSLLSKQEGKIVMTLNAVAKGSYGNIFESIRLYTNDTTTPEKRLILNANIKEDFSTLTPEQRANAPKLVFETEEFVFDTVAVGAKVEYGFVFSNGGKSDLIIRDVKASCGCTAINPEKTLLKPGESSKIGIVFNTTGRKGQQRKSVTVTANDPAKPTTYLSIQGFVKE